MERGAVVRVRRGPQPTPVAVYDRAADRQSHAKAARLRRVEGLEQARGRGLAEADAGILDGDDHPGAALTAFEGRADDEAAPLRRNFPESLGRIQDQVQEHLLELDPISRDLRQARGQRGLQEDAMSLDLRPD